VGAQDFQDPKNAVNVIIGGDSGFPTKRAIQKPLRYNEVLISFSRDDQWTSFSEPGKFPLVLILSWWAHN
jgi:hypothetical protein